MNNGITKKIIDAFLSGMKAETILPSMRIEYEEVGYWHGLWLKLTRQKPPVRPIKLLIGSDGTIILKRPDEYHKRERLSREKINSMSWQNLTPIMTRANTAKNTCLK